MIESFDPVSLPLWLLAAFAAAQYPLAIMFGAECSLCCCQKCTGCDCCGDDFSRPAGFCCEGEWRLPGSGSCCGGEFRTTEEEDGGQCCDDKWYTGSGTCCKVPTVQLAFSSSFGEAETCGGTASGKIILTNENTLIAAVLRKGGEGYARLVDDGVEVAAVTVTTLHGPYGTSPVVSVTIDDDPDSATFGRITALAIDSPGSGYDQWFTQPQEHWFDGSDGGDCCNDEDWYPAENPCPPGQVYLNLGPDSAYPADADRTCCGCFPEQIYDPRVREVVDTETVEADLLCGCNTLCIPGEDQDGDPIECPQRCCKVDGNAVTCQMLTPTECEDQGGVSSAGCCDRVGGGCDVPCCREDADGFSTCSIELNTACVPPTGIAGNVQDNVVDCEQACLGTCCVDGVPTETTLTQAACDEAGGCWAGAGSTECLTGCRAPFDESCCESVISDASGLTFTQPRRKSCEPADTLWMVTATGTTDSPILIHGVPFGQDATPAKRCAFNVTFPICWDSFNVEPMPCDTSFRRLDITVCWAPEGETLETLDYSGCSDITLWLGDCSRDCETVLTHAGPSVTVGATVQIRGDATIRANGGALVFPSGFTYVASCNVRLTLDGTGTDANSITALTDPSIGSTLSLRKTGPGRWDLTESSTYTGSTQILNGVLMVSANAPSDGNGAFGYSLNGGLGGGSSPVVVLGDGAAGVGGSAGMLLDQGAQVARLVNIPGLGVGGTQKVVLGGANTTGTTRFTDELTFFVNRDLTLQAATGGTVEFANSWIKGMAGVLPLQPLTNSFTVGSSGNAGVVLLSGNLSTSGSLAVKFGRLESAAGLAAAAGVTIDGSTAELKYTGPLPLASPVYLVQGTLSGNATIQAVDVSNSPAISVAGGDEIAISVTLSGVGTLAKTGAGTLRVTGANTFAGTLDVSAGDVVVEQIVTNPGGLVSSASFSSTALAVTFIGDPESGDEFVLLSGPTSQTYIPTLTGTTKTGTYDASTSTLTID